MAAAAAAAGAGGAAAGGDMQWANTKFGRLTNQDGDLVPAADALVGNDYVFIYFSAHWCPPCRRFTPMLKTFWEKHHAGKKFNVVFASSDQSEGEFKSYFAEMGAGMLAVPFGERGTKEKLSSEYRVQGIPTLVMLEGATGKLLSKEARDYVASDPDAESFPWGPVSPFDTLAKAPGVLKNKDGSALSVESLRGDNDYVLFYHSASWCPPCQRFTPELIKWYNKAKGPGGKASEAGNKFELVYVPSDRDAETFASYYAKMPWATLDYANPATAKMRSALGQSFGVQGIPTLVVVRTSDGSVVTTDGRDGVAGEPDAFPWLPKPVERLEASTSFLNELPVAILFVDKCTSEANTSAARAAFEAVAAEYFKDGKPSDDLRFAVATEEDAATDQVRNFLGAAYKGVKDGENAIQMAIVDVQGQRAAELNGAALAVPQEEELRLFCSLFVAGEAQGERPL